MAKSIRQWAEDSHNLLTLLEEWEGVDTLYAREEVLSTVASKAHEAFLESLRLPSDRLSGRMADIVLYTLAAAKHLDIDIVQAITDRWNAAQLKLK